jgi:AcrR family transcriptional regulator
VAGAGALIGKTASEVEATPDDRARLTDAVTKAATERGYAAIDASTIARRAGVSVEVFHRHFASEDQCLVAALDRYVDHMQEEIEDACEGVPDWDQRVRCAVEAALAYVSELDHVSRLFAVDAARIGPAAMERVWSWVDWASLRLKQGRAVHPTAAALPESTERTLIGGLVLMVSSRLLTEELDSLPGLAEEAIEMVLAPYVGLERARLVAAG